MSQKSSHSASENSASMRTSKSYLVSGLNELLPFMNVYNGCSGKQNPCALEKFSICGKCFSDTKRPQPMTTLVKRGKRHDWCKHLSTLPPLFRSLRCSSFEIVEYNFHCWSEVLRICTFLLIVSTRRLLFNLQSPDTDHEWRLQTIIKCLLNNFRSQAPKDLGSDVIKIWNLWIIQKLSNSFERLNRWNNLCLCSESDPYRSSWNLHTLT